MNLLVTGGAGFIGSHFCKAAKAAGHLPIALDNLSTGHRKFVRFGSLAKGDLRNPDFVRKIIKYHQIDAVVHFAAKAIIGESIRNPQSYYDNNVGGTRVLLQIMREIGVKQLVFSSTCSVYGIATAEKITESDATCPTHPYGKSKLSCENLIRKEHNESGLKVAILRYFNVCGQDPGGELWEDHEPETRLLPNLFRAYYQSKTFPLYRSKLTTPDGSPIRDYIDVNDLAQVHLHALGKLEQQDWLLSNICSGKGYSVREVIETFKKVFGKIPECEEKDPRPGDPPHLVADDSYYRTWCPVELKPLETIIREMKAAWEGGSGPVSTTCGPVE